MKLYASLTKSLLGIYYPLPSENVSEARAMVACSDLRKHWCSVYAESEVDEMIEKYGGVKLSAGFAKQLHYERFELEQMRIG